ncbi:MAG: hypothetical protein KatS3mg023_0515 [Armatimonadota bacterium]|nr:MAG: hypothetical protein KatS3mg023_0515 [Armatimonadota bacterium]
MKGITNSRSIEGGLWALLAGMVGQYGGYIALRLSQILKDWLIAVVSHQPRAFAEVPVGFVLVPPPHIWNVAAVVGVVIGLVAYWIHTSPLDSSARKRRKRWFNVAVVAAGILLGRGLNFISDWHILLMALDDLVSLVVALWLTWTLIGFTDMLTRRLDR